MTSRKEWFVSGIIIHVSVKRKFVSIYVDGNLSSECYAERFKINCIMPKKMFPSYMPCINRVLNAKGHLISDSKKKLCFLIESIE